VIAGRHRKRMAAAGPGPSNYPERLLGNEIAKNDRLDAMDDDEEGEESHMEGMEDRDEFMGNMEGGITDDNLILQDAAASVRNGAWPKPWVGEYLSDEEEEDSDTLDEDNDWESQPEDSDDDELTDLSAWDALGGNFARELTDVGQFIPLSPLFTSLNVHVQPKTSVLLTKQFYDRSLSRSSHI
jgi:hypothetical protein